LGKEVRFPLLFVRWAFCIVLHSHGSYFATPTAAAAALS
jgi:hypothetical protein